MRDTLTIILPPKTKRLLELVASEYVRLAIFRKLWQDAAEESRHVSVPSPHY
jgi:hypothetical protein